MLSLFSKKIAKALGLRPKSQKTKEQLQDEIRALMEQMSRTSDLEECCRFLSVLLLAFTFETTKEGYHHLVGGRGEVAVKIDKRWRWHESASGVRVCNWENHCFGEKKGEKDTWML